MVSGDHGTMATFENIMEKICQSICRLSGSFIYICSIAAGFECFEWVWTMSTQKLKTIKTTQMILAVDWSTQIIQAVVGIEVEGKDMKAPALLHIITMVVSYDSTAHPS